MYLKTSVEFEDLVKTFEKALGEQGLEFVHNRTSQLVEFEISSPSYLRIVIETRKDPEVHNFILPSLTQAKGCTIEIRFALEATENEEKEGRVVASRILNRVHSFLGRDPWSGLRFREVNREKKKWKEAMSHESHREVAH